MKPGVGSGVHCTAGAPVIPGIGKAGHGGEPTGHGGGPGGNYSTHVQVHFALRGVSSHDPHQPFVLFLWWQQSCTKHTTLWPCD